MPDFDAELGAELPAVRQLLRRLTGQAHDADDLAQETWLRAQRYRDAFDAGGSMAGWLGRIAFRLFLDWRERRAREPRPLAEPDASAAPAGDDVDRREWIERKLQLLRPLERDILLRFHRAGESVAAIAMALGLPEGTVRSHLHRARQRLAAEERP